MFIKKGQVSVELLIIISALIIAAIIFTVIYLSSLRDKSFNQEEMSAISDDFLTDHNQYIIPIIYFNFFLKTNNYLENNLF